MSEFTILTNAEQPLEHHPLAALVPAMSEDEQMLALISRTRDDLARVEDPSEAASFVQKADAIRYFAKKACLSDEAQNQAVELALRAKRRAGELLAEREKAPTGPKPELGDIVSPNYPPTLREIGIEPQDSKRWQRIAAVPEPEFEAYVAEKSQELTTAGLLAAERTRQKVQRRADTAAALATPVPLPSTVEILCGDFRELEIEPGSVDAVVTDPPYSAKHLPLWTALAEWATKALRPGGHLLAMSGQMYLPDVIQAIKGGSTELTYWWTFAYLTPGGQAVQIWPRQVNTFWKPVLWYTKGDPEQDGWVGDVTRSDINDNDKRFHEWGQSFSGMRDLMARLVKPGWLIADPMCGAGTTGAAAVALDCRFMGIEADTDRAAMATARLAAELQ